jgi:hypothetical protein
MMKDFFIRGGVYLYPMTSGMAHLAGACGLYTVTIYYDFDP